MPKARSLEESPELERTANNFALCPPPRSRPRCLNKGNLVGMVSTRLWGERLPLFFQVGAAERKSSARSQLRTPQQTNMNTFDTSLARLQRWAGGNKLSKPKQINPGFVASKQHRNPVNVPQMSFAGIAPPSTEMLDRLRSRPYRHL